MYFLKSGSEADIFRESPIRAHSGMDQSVLRPAATWSSVQNVPFEQITDRRWIHQIDDSVGSNITAAQVEEGSGNYSIPPDRPSDVIPQTHRETRKSGQEIDSAISDTLTEEIFYVNPKQYHRILKQRIARQRLIENKLLICSENIEDLRKASYVHSLKRLRSKGENFLTADELIAFKESVGNVKSESKKMVSEGWQMGWSMQKPPDVPQSSGVPWETKWATIEKSEAEQNADLISAGIRVPFDFLEYLVLGKKQIHSQFSIWSCRGS